LRYNGYIGKVALEKGVIDVTKADRL
jgi:hypothetical protein